jgi:hypothetical protein
MKTLNYEQMASVDGGINWCAVAEGVTGLGGVGLLLGLTMGPIALAAYASIAVMATGCALMES